MKLQDLKRDLLQFGFYPIHIKGTVDEERDKGFSFSGNFEEYLDCLKNLNVKPIYISTLTVEDGDLSKFFATDKDESVEKLLSVMPDLKNFERYTQDIGIYKISSSLSDQSLNFYIYEDWWIELVNMTYLAIQEIQNIEEQEAIKASEQESEREETLLIQLAALLNDKDFCNFKTQRAMTNYALEKIPDLKMIDPSLLKREILNLYDKIRG